MKTREIRVNEPDADGCIYVSTQSVAGTDIGGLTMCPTRHGTMRVGWIAVKPMFRRRGVATQLYQAAAREACERGRPLESDRRLARGSLAFWRKQVRKGRATLRDDPDGRTYALKCPAPSDLSGTTGSSGLRQNIRQWADARRQLDKLNKMKVRPLKCYGPHGYVAAKGKTYRSAKLTDDERAHLFSILDQRCRRFQLGACYYNAMITALDDPTEQLKYVEGYAIRDGIPMPIHHGWLTINNKVVDLTWRLRTPRRRGRLRNRMIGEFVEGLQYVGVEFPTSQVRRYVVETGVGDSIIDDWRRGWPLFKKEGC
ncbi:MAG: GNAT family N-acetyltransferase [Gemmatimonadota bacterium]|nr:MAG: GNAT family N-acetyltransferase [Gemmatimonadota bacterium]